jgi:transcriptional regulator with XRE-family HTH domain
VDPAALRTIVAGNIRAAARRKRLTINSLADFSAVSRAQMFNVLAGSSSATTDWLAKIATALDVEPWQLLAPEQFKRTKTPRA